MAESKNLLPKCTAAKTAQQPNTWEKLDACDQVVRSIEIGSTSNEDANFNLLVSSVPSPWARVHLTQHALGESRIPTDNIISQYYSFLRSEWRGLIAAYVLYPDSFELTRPIELKAKKIEDRHGKFDILSTYSEMLFEDTPLWKYGIAQQDEPKMQILYYKKGENRFSVGATSPFSIFFCSMNYSMQPNGETIYWINKSGKFQDPASKDFENFYLEGGSDYNETHFRNLKRLYSFINGVLSNLKKEGGYIDELRTLWNNAQNKKLKATGTPGYDRADEVLSTALQKWKEEIEEILGNSAEKSKNIPVNHKRLEGPLGNLLRIKYTYYWYNNAFYTFSKEALELANKVADGAVDVDKLFINGDCLATWRDCSYVVTNSDGTSTGETEHDFRKSPVYFLHADDPDKSQRSWFFAMPLSEYALKEVFKNELESIIDGENHDVKLVAKKTDSNTVRVTLEARINAQEGDDYVTICDKIFTTENIQPRSLFAWPNFCSQKWKKYYYYSEFPTNAPKGIQMIPEFEGKENFERLTENANPESFLWMVKYPVDSVSSNHPYEIIRTDTPLERIRIQGQYGNMGWLIIRKKAPSNSFGGQWMKRLDSGTLEGVTVGFDFGSTNSCAYYMGKEYKAIPFSNKRLAIVGFDNKPKEPAQFNELLFVSNEEPLIDNGQIKSWLHEHNENFIKGQNTETELIGGVPVNETNINVFSMDEYSIQTQAGKLHYNMKWLQDNEGKKRKMAFIKMVWIQICADLFTDNKYPQQLNWSYPSAMGATDMNALRDVFTNIESPYNGDSYKLKESAMKSYTEAEAVCSYALSQKIALSTNNLFLGIDVGGSTSDILVLGKDLSRFQDNQAPSEPLPKKQQASPAPAPAPAPTHIQNINYDDMGRSELVNIVRERGLERQADLEEWGRKQIADFLTEYDKKQQNVDYDELSRKQLCDLARQRGLDRNVDLDDLGRSQIVDLLKRNESCGDDVNYDDLGRGELCDLMRQRGFDKDVVLDDMGRSQIVDYLKAHRINTSRQSENASPVTNSVQSSTSQAYIASDKAPVSKDGRLFTQCSVRLAAGEFFDAIRGSKKFRDCIRRFQIEKVVPTINVYGIENMENDKLKAPYYLNNIFDQLNGEESFKRFYGYLKNNVPFVFTLPAYIVGVLMAYSGMLIRKTIITKQMTDIDKINIRYYGKGGRLFEWLFFTFNDDYVKAYLKSCFNVGLNYSQIKSALGITQTIDCVFDNFSKIGSRKESENKSEVAIGLVTPKDIAGIEPRIITFEEDDNVVNKDDVRKQELLGEKGIRIYGFDGELDELMLVDDNFYKNRSNIVYPTKFENFSQFINIFTKFVGSATSVYPEAEDLKAKLESVNNVDAFIANDPEYKKYISNIANGRDSYRMPVFIATSLYFLKNVLLPDVFENN